MKPRGRMPGWSALRKRCLLAGLIACGSAVISPRAIAQTAPRVSDEYQVKAAFLFNFAQFVEWPAQAFPTPDSPFVIGILGEDPFGSYLDDLVKGETVGHRPFVIRRCQSVREVNECHILYVSRSESASLEKILGELKHRQILTISDLAAFNRYGGMVRFVTETGKIRLRINLESAKAANLTISSKILRPSTIVSSAND